MIRNHTGTELADQVAHTTAAAVASGAAPDWSKPAPGAPTWETITPGWNWRLGDWTIDRRVTDHGTEFVVFHGNSPEEITTDVYAAKEFAEAEIAAGKV